MPATSTIEGTFHAAGRAINGATAYLIPAAVFTSQPQVGDPIPTASAIATCVTGPANGSDGAYRFLNQPQQQYYVALAFAGLTAFDYQNASAVGVGASGQLTLNSSSAYANIPFEVLVDGTHRFHVGTGPSGSTHVCSGHVGLNGPWSYASPTTQAPPPALQIRQHPANAGTPSSGAATWINVNDRWGIGVLDATNPSDLAPTFPPASYPGGGNCLFFADLLQNENRMLLDSDGELRLETKNPLGNSNWYNLTLQRVTTGVAASGILQTGTGVGFGIGWRTVMPGGICTSFISELYDATVSSLTSIFSIYNRINAVDTLSLRCLEQGGLWIPGGTNIAAGGTLGVIRAGNDFNFSGSAGGTIYAGAAKAGFAGNWIDFQVAGTQAMQVTAAGQCLHTLVDAASTGQGYALQLRHQVIGATPAIGVGTGIQFYAPNSNGTQAERGVITLQMATVTPGSEDSQWIFTNTSGGTGHTCLTINSVGDLLPLGAVYAAAAASSTRGSVNLGAGGFTGSGTSFAGSAAGTQLAINGSTSYTGDLINAQCSGSTKFKIDYTGKATIAGDLAHTGTKCGFNGTAPIAKAALTGVKSGGTALTNLIAALVNLGLISDSTT